MHLRRRWTLMSVCGVFVVTSVRGSCVSVSKFGIREIKFRRLVGCGCRQDQMLRCRVGKRRMKRTGQKNHSTVTTQTHNIERESVQCCRRLSNTICYLTSRYSPQMPCHRKRRSERKEEKKKKNESTCVWFSRQWIATRCKHRKHTHTDTRPKKSQQQLERTSCAAMDGRVHFMMARQHSGSEVKVGWDAIDTRILCVTLLSTPVVLFLFAVFGKCFIGVLCVSWVEIINRMVVLHATHSRQGRPPDWGIWRIYEWSCLRACTARCSEDRQISTHTKKEARDDAQRQWRNAKIDCTLTTLHV